MAIFNKEDIRSWFKVAVRAEQESEVKVSLLCSSFQKHGSAEGDVDEEFFLEVLKDYMQSENLSFG